MFRIAPGGKWKELPLEYRSRQHPNGYTPMSLYTLIDLSRRHSEINWGLKHLWYESHTIITWWSEAKPTALRTQSTKLQIPRPKSVSISFVSMAVRPAIKYYNKHTKHTNERSWPASRPASTDLGPSCSSNVSFIPETNFRHNQRKPLDNHDISIQYIKNAWAAITRIHMPASHFGGGHKRTPMGMYTSFIFQLWDESLLYAF